MQINQYIKPIDQYIKPINQYIKSINQYIKSINQSLDSNQQMSRKWKYVSEVAVTNQSFIMLSHIHISEWQENCPNLCMVDWA